MNFFKTMFATMLGSFLMFILLVVTASLILGAMMSNKDSIPTVTENSVLQIKLNKAITDRASDNPLENFDYMSLESKSSMGLIDILEAIDKAKNDDKIKGIFLDLSGIQAGWATVQEIRSALLSFKDSEKFILAYADAYDQKMYYLASVANQVYMHPEGEFMLIGLGAEIMYYKDALAKLGIEPEVIRHGKFKAAVEPFLSNEMSEANREQTSLFLGTIWKNVLTDISASRKIDVQDLNMMADSLLVSLGESTIEYKLMDSLKYRDEIIAELKIKTEQEDTKELNKISLSDYIKVPKDDKGENKGLAKDKIAIIYATGEIIMGKSTSETVGSESVAEALRTAREDKKVKAVVFRINSPGGSALASDIIWREMMLLKGTKPLIVSMGDYAASGGYYIACPADTILANSNTITGSIGVFGLLFNGEKLLNEKMGINVETVRTNSFSDIGTMMRKMTPKERNTIQGMVEKIYGTFIDHVAKGRNIPIAEVDSIGQGRVWSGTNAMKINLVDLHGGLQDAIRIAAEKSNVEHYRLISLPKQKDPMAMILENLSIKIKDDVLKEQLGFSYKYFKLMERMANMKDIQTRLPFEISISN